MWTWDAYLEWEPRQSVRYELVNGEVYAMTGGTMAHDVIGNNLRSMLLGQLRGKPCRLQGPDAKVKAGENGRYPDALIDCGRFNPNALFASEPVAVFEVLSKTTELFDQNQKLDDYDAVPSIRFYVLISQIEPKALIYQRDQHGRFGPTGKKVVQGSASIDLAGIAIALPLAGLYDGIDFASFDA